MQTVNRNLVNVVFSLDKDGFTLKKSHKNVQNLKRNLISVVILLHKHIYSGEKPHKCSEFAKKFRQYSGLSRHK